MVGPLKIAASLTNSAREGLELFVERLSEANRELNLTGAATREEIWRRHIADSLAAAEVLRALARETEGDVASSDSVPRTLIDVGSGAGFPGLVLAAALPEWRVVSVEATGKKARFQEQIVRELDLANASVIAERSETLARDPAYRERYDAATCRAVGNLAVVAELTLPFLRSGGVAIAWKGAGRADEEIAVARPALEKLGGDVAETIPYSLPGEGGNETIDFRLVVLRKEGPIPEKYPRRPGIPAKRPLR